MLVLILGALVTWDRVEHPKSTPVVETAQSTVVPEASTSTSADPWESDELSDYSSMVAWESWVEEGDQS
jgi:hypothetical protein